MSVHARRKAARSIRDISIAIDTWDDIFSDFDPRPLSERTLSEDFIFELTKRSHESRKGHSVITICAPGSLRNDRAERIASTRIRLYLAQRAALANDTIRRQRTRGVVFALCGFIFLSTLTIMGYEFKPWFGNLGFQFVEIILMPLGWFGIWEGVSKIVDVDRLLLQEAALYDRLAHATYRFTYLEDEE
jgi:hypothetical protein